MTVRALAGLVLLSAALSGCAASTESGRPSVAGLSIVPASGGLDVVPSGQEIGFGRFQPGAVAAVSRVLGRDPSSVAVPPGCTLTEVRWAREDLSMYFADRAFVGWSTSSASSGTGCGRATPES